MKWRLIAMVISMAVGGSSTMMLKSDFGRQFLQWMAKSGASPFPDDHPYNKKKRPAAESAAVPPAKRPTTQPTAKTPVAKKSTPAAPAGKKKHPTSDEELFAKYGSNFGYDTGSPPSPAPSTKMKPTGSLGEAKKSPFDRKSAADGLIESVKNMAGMADNLSPLLGVPPSDGVPFGVDIPNGSANPADMKAVENILKSNGKSGQ